MPRDLAEQAEVDRWMDFLLANVLSPLAFEVRRTGGVMEGRSGPDERWGNRALDVIDGRLADREFLVGDTLSAADCAHASLFRIAAPPLLDGRDYLNRYLGALSARPTWAAAATKLLVAGS